MIKLILVVLFLTSFNVVCQTSAFYEEKGMLEYSKGNTTEAVELLVKSFEIDSTKGIEKDYLFLYNIGIMYMEIDSLNNSLTFLNKSLMQNEFYPAIENKAICLYYMGLTEEAFETISKGLQIKPNYIEAVKLKVIFSLELNRLENILNEISQVKDKSNESILFYKAITLLRLDRKSEAKIQIQELESFREYSSKKSEELWLYYAFKIGDDQICKKLSSFESKFDEFNIYQFHDPKFIFNCD